MNMVASSVDTEWTARRTHLAYRIAALSTIAALALSIVAQTSLAIGVPSARRLLPCALAMAGLGVLARRGWRHAPAVVTWFLAVAIPMLIVEPGLTRIPDFSFLFAPLAALALSGRKTLWGTVVLSLAILIARCPHARESPYLDLSLLVMVALMVAAMTVVHETMHGAFVALSRRRAIEGAAARAGNEVIFWSEPSTEGTTIRYASSSVQEVLGAPFVDDGRSPLDHIHPDDRQLAQTAYTTAQTSPDRSAQFECRVWHAEGRWLWGALRIFDLRDDPLVAGTVTCIRDVTDERFERETQADALVHAAEHDWLTGLPNRRKLALDLARIEKRDPAPVKASVWILFCDVDSFKDVNDTLGHAKGDSVLLSLASRLGHVAPERSLYRFGGDEFVIVADDMSTDAVERLAGDLVATAGKATVVEGQTISTELSIGVARIDAGGSEDALRAADIAMYSAKKMGKNRYCVFDKEMGVSAERRRTIGQALRGALQNNELHLLYQPKVDARSGQCVGFEALLRWRSASLGPISPGEFIPVAEELGLIADIGDYVISQVCAQLEEWGSVGLKVPVSANVSAAQLADRDRVVDHVRTMLAQHRISPELLELEITESALVHDATEVTAILRRIRELGVALSVDDFGTGYSSLAYIRRFPVSSLKLDRSFIVDLDKQPESRAIVRAVLTLARDLQLETIAEGVETEEQRSWLHELGCDILQGYLFARPLSPADARAFATKNRSQAPHVEPRRARALERSLTPFPLVINERMGRDREGS